MSTSKWSKREAAQVLLLADWKHPVGTSVNVRKDSGELVRTKTRSEPWMMGGTAVILVDGITGCYALERLTHAPEQPAAAPQK